MADIVLDRGRVKFKGPDGRLYLWRKPTTKAELGEYFRMFFGYILATTAHPDCEERGHSAPLDVAWSIYSGYDYRTGDRMPICVLKGSRGLAGKSTLLAGVSTLEGLEGMKCVVLGGSAAQSKRVHEAGTEIWDHEVELGGVKYEQPLRHLIDDPLAMETRFVVSGAWRRAITASRKSARSPHPHRLRLDEVDEMDLDVFDSAMGQTMTEDEVSRPTQTCCASTHQHPKGTFTEVLKRAVERGWPIYEICYRENLVSNGGWLEPVQVEHKRKENTNQAWDVEFELQEPSPEGRAIQTENVVKAFDPAHGTFRGAEGELITMPCCSLWTEERGWCRTHSYAMGADWAQRRDWSVMVVYRTDVSPWWMVAWLRQGRRPWPHMIEKFNEVRALFGGEACLAAHDVTGLGTVVDDYLDLDAQAVILSGTRRDTLFKDYIVALEHDDFMHPRIEFARQEHMYCTNKDLYTGGERGHPPDSFIAGCLAWSLRVESTLAWSPVAGAHGRLLGGVAGPEEVE